MLRFGCEFVFGQYLVSGCKPVPDLDARAEEWFILIIPRGDVENERGGSQKRLSMYQLMLHPL